jgi:hypothetical protein
MKAALALRLVFVALFTLSCAAAEETPIPKQQDVNEVRHLREENDALRRQLKEKDDAAALRDQYISQVTRSLNEVQDNLTDLTRKQQDVSKQYVRMIEEGKRVTTTQRDDLTQKIRALQQEVSTTSAALVNARKKAEGNNDGARVAELVRLVEKLQTEVETRGTQIAMLQETVANLQLDVQQRDQIIVAQGTTIASNNAEMQRQEQENVRLALEKYRVFYRVDTYDRLSEDNVIEHRSGGVWTLSTKNFDSTKLKEAHKSGLVEIRIDKPKGRLKLVTIHSRNSYEMVRGSSRQETIFRILDREKFWTAGPYLVIAVK